MQEEWSSHQVRETFLNFFSQKNHRRLPSFPLVPAKDPTLLFTAAGMAPFKAEFAGLAKPISPRITTCQKCVRADDIEKVGHTSRHHTFFEMLGNFSFGDYFKKEAISWAWELLTQRYKLPGEKLWVSVHRDDDQSYDFWKKEIGIPPQKLFRFPDNFWGPIGPTGTCGPDSEIYYDQGAPASCGKSDCKPGCENTNPRGEPCDRFLELWNLVFTMYHKDEQGRLHELPQKNIDTGAGLERITMVLQKKSTPFETDLFYPVIHEIDPNYHRLTPHEKIAPRIIADHIRAVTFMIADGVTPSNEGRGYVLQRLIRRALLFRQPIKHCPPLTKLAEQVVDLMKEVYSELSIKKNEGSFEFYLKRADEEFKKVLELGNELFTEALGSLTSVQGKKVVPGSLLFRFHDERGFPFELAKEFLQAKGYDADEKGFREEMEKQRLRSRGGKQATDRMAQALQTQSISWPVTQFTGYEQNEIETVVEMILKDNLEAETLHPDQEGLVILKQTPFYAEGGGQVGDTGTLRFKEGEADVLDTQKNEGGTFFHRIIVKSGTLRKGVKVHASLHIEKREQTKKHHTAAHLLHAALRLLLGMHVQQAGSYVCDQYLRLDFSHSKQLSNEELFKIEALVNEKIYENLPVNAELSTQEEAKKQGALAFFDEKYGEHVRVIAVNRFSKELCGGTHVSFTGELGPFIIVKESSIAKGMRRIEAKAGKSAVLYLADLQQLKSNLTERFKVDASEVLSQIDQLLSRQEEQQKEILRLKQRLAQFESQAFLEKARSIHGITCLLEVVKADEKETLRSMVDALKEKLKSAIILLASVNDNKVNLVCAVTPDLVSQNFSAVELVRLAARTLDGSGGGRPELAEAGGKNPEQIKTAFEKAVEFIEKKANQPSHKTQMTNH